ncbi:MAG: hypothetical protein HKN05_16550 [Rhizobiales bacterium]|nr:hypothetical protein [Hyphomicrobiales bacterium]
MVTDDVSKKRDQNDTVTLILKFRRQARSERSGATDSRDWRASLENVQTGERRYCESFACIEDVFCHHGFSDAKGCPDKRGNVFADLAKRLMALLAGRSGRSS